MDTDNGEAQMEIILLSDKVDMVRITGKVLYIYTARRNPFDSLTANVPLTKDKSTTPASKSTATPSLTPTTTITAAPKPPPAPNTPTE